MKKILFIIFFLPLISRGQTSSLPTDSVLYLQYDTIIGEDTVWVYPYYFDNVHYQGLYIDSTMPDGQYNGYLNDSSTLLVKVRYQNYRPEGIVYYYRNGKIRSTYTYKNGEKDGPYTYYNDNGELDAVGSYVNGKEHGWSYEFWDNGRIKRLEYSDMGTTTGPYKYYHSNGQIDTEGKYDKAGEDLGYLTGYRVGKWTHYYENGKIKEEQYYVDSISTKEKLRIAEYRKAKNARPEFPIGSAITYDISGKKTSEYIYKDYFLVKFVKYYSNGKEKEVTNYTDFHQGFCSQNPSYYIKGGQYNEYYESGNKKAEGNYLNNEKDGEWNTWSENGQLIKKEKYKNGKLKK
jgi:antitoxin component YwqK of YwqJK toxin-antitoxin module